MQKKRMINYNEEKRSVNQNQLYLINNLLFKCWDTQRVADIFQPPCSKTKSNMINI